MIQEIKKSFGYIFEDDLIDEIALVGRIQDFEDGEIIIDFGMPIPFMPIIVEGHLKVMTQDHQENELLLYYLEFGESCAATLSCCAKNAKSKVKAMAEGHAKLLFIPISYMDQWMAAYKSWRNFILETYNLRMNELLSALDQIVFESLEKRLEDYMRTKAEILRTKTLHLSHQEIADEMHSSRVVISRLLKKLEHQGIISLGRNKILILE